MTVAITRARRARIGAKGTAATVLAVLALASCGGADEAAPNDSVEVVRTSIEGFGTTQAIRCEKAGELEARGLPVVRCGFEEEEDVSGVMRAQARCYVVEAGAVVDVTGELPVRTSCMISDP